MQTRQNGNKPNKHEEAEVKMGGRSKLINTIIKTEKWAIGPRKKRKKFSFTKTEKKKIQAMRRKTKKARLSAYDKIKIEASRRPPTIYEKYKEV